MRNEAIASVEVEPRVTNAGSWDSYTVRLLVGRAGFPVGAGFKVQLPRSWHVWHRNSAKGVHSEDRVAPNYVRVRCTEAASRLGWEVEGGSSAEYVKSLRLGLEGQRHRYNYVVRVWVVEGYLGPGAIVSVIYGDRDGGSRGFAAALHPEGPERVLVSVDPGGHGHYELLPLQLLPTLETVASRAVELVAIAPSQAALGERALLRLVALDEFYNAAPLEGVVRLKLVEGVADVPTEVAWERGPKPLLIPIIPLDRGILRIEASIASLGTVSNPVECSAEPQPLGIYWGDFHCHAADSFDATGNNPFAYAREVAGLDFFALTDHVEGWPEDTWAKILRLNSVHYDPGRFVTLVGYEATFPAPYGHHNVVFRGRDGPRVGEDRGTVHDLWHALTKGDALTTPHHTGVCFSAITGFDERHACPAVDWTIRHDDFRRVLEIYSGHGQCEIFDPTHPLSYENCDFSLNHSKNGPHYAWDGWLTGQTMGTVCSSDNHTGQPGKHNTGLAAVCASELTREAVFDSLAKRHVYGTTGARILLRFAANDVPMGGATTTDSSVKLSMHTVGTDRIELVELVRGDLEQQRLKVVAAWQPQEDRHAGEWIDRSPPRLGFYYLRLRQQKKIGGRVPMAWSSPIWINPQG